MKEKLIEFLTMVNHDQGFDLDDETIERYATIFLDD